MYELCVKTHFSAAHRLAQYKGRCARVHGHNWEVEVFVRGETLDATGLLVDFRKMKEVVNGVVGELDHADLNQLASFAAQNPSSENIARYLYESMVARWHGRNCRVHRVCVAETPGASASYWEDVNG